MIVSEIVKPQSEEFMKMRLFNGMAMVTSLLMLLACEPNVPTQLALPDAKAGKALVQEKCIACHDLQGHGVNEDIPHLAAQVESYLVAALHAYKEDKREHAALKDIASHMSDADMRNVAAFFAGLPPVKVAVAQDAQDIMAQGKAAATLRISASLM